MNFTEWTAGGARVPINGHQVFIRQDGPADGRPLTLIHGFPTSSHDWAPLIPGLTEAGHRVTTFDLLGFGASDKPHPHAYSLIDQASLVESVWSHLGIGPTALVAHDYGVSVAQELLSRDPDRITHMVWLNGGVYPDLHRPIPIQKLMHGPAGRVLGRLATERTYRSAMHQILGRPVSDAEIHEMWRATSSNRGAIVQHDLLHYIDERRLYASRWIGALENYPGPALFVWGPGDPVSGAHVLARIRERMPEANIVSLDTTPPTGHYPQLESPAEVLAALVPFLGTGQNLSDVSVEPA